MAKQILSEEFRKMQKLAGIKLNENDEIDYDDENFSDPMIDGYNDDDFIDLNLSFQESPEYHSYDEVLDIIKSYEDKDILEDFKSTFLEDEKVLGTCHIALGNNYSFGGKVNVPIHLDGIIKKPTIIFDDKIIMKEGKLLI